jgi:hypothetical protein
MLDRIHRGLAQSKEMFAAFAALDLIDQVKLEIRLNAEETHNLPGYYSVNAEKLRALDASALASLHKSGFLECAYLVLSSINNVQRLVDIKVARVRAAAAS